MSDHRSNVFNPISATNLTNVVIAVQGNLHLPTNITAVSAIVAKTPTWFTIKGSNIDWVGTKDVNNGWIYSYGQAWWDANPPGGTGIVGRPHLLSFNAQTATIQHFKSMKPVAWNVNLQGSNIVVTDTIIDAYSTTSAFPFNTDGFDVGGTNITIKNSVIYNGDDAVAIGSGASNVLFQGATIGYQTHGMSIGSLGSNQASVASVNNIKFDDVTVINGVYAARFKSWQGGQGLAKNVTWSNIRVYNVTFPIFVTQSYSNQATSSSTPRPNNSSVIMQDFTWTNFTGTINQFSPGDGSCVTNPCWYNVGLPNLAHTEAVIIECNTDSSCQNFALSNIEVFPQAGGVSSTAICINCTSANNPKLGFGGQNGTFVPTA